MNKEAQKQEILGQLVERDIIMNASMLVDDLLEVNKLSIDDIENYYTFHCIDDGEELENVGGDYPWQCPSCGKVSASPEDDGMESEPREIFEWWFVTEFMYKDLKNQGQPVMDTNYGYLWGRCTTGQAIKMDYVIEKIAEEMEILPGMKHDWSK